MTKTLSRLVCLILAIVIWGSSISISKYMFGGAVGAAPSVEPLYLAIRFAIGASVLAAYMAVRKISLRFVGRLYWNLLSGILLAAGFMLQTHSLSDPSTTSIEVAFLSVFCFLVFIPLFSKLMSLDVSKSEWIGVVFGLLAMVIAIQGNIWIFMRNAFAILACACWSLQIAVTSKYCESGNGKYSWTLYTLLFAIPCYILVGALNYNSLNFLQLYSSAFWLACALTGVFATAIAFQLESYALSIDRSSIRHVSPAQAGLISSFEPFATLATSYVLLAEAISIWHIIAFMVVLVANTISFRKLS
jgi:drug/metabolite transporter (DMT)-like permease